MNNMLLERLVSAIEKISEDGIRVEVNLYDARGLMRNDLGAKKIADGLEQIASALIDVDSVCDE